MDALFSPASIGAAALTSCAGAALALALSFGSEKQDKGTEGHHKAGSVGADIASGRAFSSKSTGLSLAYRVWRPARAPECVVCILHGFGEHAARYDHVAEELCGSAGALVVAFDQQGHGASEGVRAHAERFEDLVTDGMGFLEFAQGAGLIAAELPLFLLGHSMGGLIAARMADRIASGAGAAGVSCDTRAGGVRLAGLVLTSPFFMVAPEHDTALLRAASSFLSSALPLLPVVAMDLPALARDDSVRSQYRSDPLVYHGLVRARMGAELAAATRAICADAESLTFPPLLLMYGGADRIVHPDGSKRVGSACTIVGGGEKTVVEMEGGFHEILNDVDRREVLARVVAFLVEHTRPA